MQHEREFDKQHPMGEIHTLDDIQRQALNDAHRLAVLHRQFPEATLDELTRAVELYRKRDLTDQELTDLLRKATQPAPPPSFATPVVPPKRPALDNMVKRAVAYADKLLGRKPPSDNFRI